MGLLRLVASATLVSAFIGILPSHVQAAVDLSSNGVYLQDFNGLAWATTGSSSDFGMDTSSTQGWVVSTSGGANRARYFYCTQATTFASSSIYSGILDPSHPEDRSYVYSPDTTNSTNIGLFVHNPSSQTFTTARIAFTLEVWKSPTVTTTGGLLSYAVVDYDVQPSGGGFGPVLFVKAADFNISKATAVGTMIPFSVTLTNLNWTPGNNLAIKFSVPPTFGKAGVVMGLDDVSVTVPEPSVVMFVIGAAAIVGLSRPKCRGQRA